MRSRLTLAAAAFAAGLLLAALWTLRPRHRGTPPPLPELDLRGLQAEVAGKIGRLVDGLAAAPSSADRWGELAMNLDVHDLRRESIACYARAAELDPGEVRWPYYAAIALEDMGSDASLAGFERALELAPGAVPVQVRYARALLRRERWDEAAGVLRQALAAAPETSHAHLELARIALARGDPRAALDPARRAVEAAPDHGEAHGLLAEIYRRLERPNDARRALARAARSPSETPLPDPLLRSWTAQGTSAFWHLQRGHLAFERGAFEDAVRELEPALAAEPDAQEYSNLGVAYRRLGKLADAEASFREALALDPLNRDALVNLGSALRALGRSEEAIAYAEAALAADASFAESYVNLGVLYLEAGRFADAVHSLRDGLARAPGDLRIALRLAWVLAAAPSAGERDGAEAVRLARVVCDADPQPVAVHLDVLAAALAESGEFVRAVATAARARDLALAGHRAELARQIGARLEGYRVGRPHRLATS